MSNYVDVFVSPVRKDAVDAYRSFDEGMSKIWREHGALSCITVIADDVKSGVVTSFPQALKLEANETIAVGWITYASREDRDRVNAAAMKDPRMAAIDPKSMPFDGKRMFWGGFKKLFEV